jgi:hypothetical protein
MIAISAFTWEIHIPFYFIHANNFLSGTIVETYNNIEILEMEHDYNVFGMGGGAGIDYYFDQRSRWFGDGIYFRFNYYNPYRVTEKNIKIKTFLGTLPDLPDSENDINNSFSFDFSIGSILRFKYKSFEFPLVLAFVLPRIAKIDIGSDELGKEGVVDFGLLLDVGIKYFFTDKFFANIGGRYGIGIGLAGFPDAKLGSGVEITELFFPSQIVSGYLGVGVKL